MFVQMFDRFRPYFSLFVNGLPAMFVLPLTIRLYRYPCALVSTFLSISQGFLRIHLTPDRLTTENKGSNIPTALGNISAHYNSSHTYAWPTFGSSKPTHYCSHEISISHFLLRTSGSNITFYNLSSNVACDWKWKSQLYIFSVPRIWDVCNDSKYGFC